MTSDNSSQDRRTFTTMVGAGVIGTLAGCVGDDDDGAEDDAGEDVPSDDQGTDETDTGSGNGEDDRPGSEGLVYAFAPEEISLVDPDQGTVEDVVADDLGGRDWGDARLAGDGSKLFAVDGSLGQIAVIDTASRELLEWVDIGSGPVHAYLPKQGELWAHADDEGAFYVLDTESHDVIEVVEAGLENDGHGKLIHHDDLSPLAYATNTNDSAALVIDLEEYERAEAIDVGEGPGTHYAAYAPANGLVYYEWFGGETVVIDPETNDIVDRLDSTGGLKVSPDGSRLGMWEDDQIHFFDASTDATAQLGTVDLDGRGPDDIDFFEGDGTTYAFVANTTAPEVSVIDVDAMEVLEHIPAGAIEQGGEHLHRAGDSGDGVYVTSAGADGTVAVIDKAEQSLLHEVEVADGVDTVRYVPETSI